MKGVCGCGWGHISICFSQLEGDGKSPFGNWQFQIKRFVKQLENSQASSKAQVICEKTLSMMEDIATCSVANLPTLSRDVRVKKLTELLAEGIEITPKYTELLIRKEVEEQKPIDKDKVGNIVDILSPWATGFDCGSFDPILPRLSAMLSLDSFAREAKSVSILAECILLPLVRRGKEGANLVSVVCKAFMDQYKEWNPDPDRSSTAVQDCIKALDTLLVVMDPVPTTTKEESKSICEMLAYRGQIED